VVPAFLASATWLIPVFSRSWRIALPRAGWGRWEYRTLGTLSDEPTQRLDTCP
jgi:hypothetical protein